MFDQATNNTVKEKQRQIIKQDIDNFLALGGKVDTLPSSYFKPEKDFSQTWHNVPLISDAAAFA